MRGALALLLASGAPAVAPCGTGQWQPYIAEASQRHGIPETWIHAVMRAESTGCTHMHGAPIVSHAGAMGLMQLMPATWAELRDRLALGDDPHDPRDNILAGAAYLAQMHRQFGVPGAFAAYHAGPGRYGAYVEGRSSLPAETWRYLVRVTTDVGIPASVPDGGENADATVFAITRNRSSAKSHGDLRVVDSRLFVQLRRHLPVGDDEDGSPLREVHDAQR